MSPGTGPNYNVQHSTGQQRTNGQRPSRVQQPSEVPRSEENQVQPLDHQDQIQRSNVSTAPLQRRATERIAMDRLSQRTGLSSNQTIDNLAMGFEQALDLKEPTSEPRSGRVGGGLEAPQGRVEFEPFRQPLGGTFGSASPEEVWRGTHAATKELAGRLQQLPGVARLSAALARPGEFSFGGHTLTVSSSNSYLNLKDRSIIRASRGTGPTYPQMKEALLQRIESGSLGSEADVARTMRRLLTTEPDAPSDPAVALLTAVLGGAEASRNPRALTTLLMFLDLVEAGQASFKEGLGVNQDQLRKEIGDLKGRKVTNDFKDPEVLELFSIASNPRVKAGQALETHLREAGLASDHLPRFAKHPGKFNPGKWGGTLPMTGDDTVALGGKNAFEGNKVQMKEASLVSRWLKLKSASNQDDPASKVLNAFSKEKPKPGGPGEAVKSLIVAGLLLPESGKTGSNPLSGEHGQTTKQDTSSTRSAPHPCGT